MAGIIFRNGSYRITVSCGYNDQGKKIREDMTWTPPEGLSTRQVERELKKVVHDFEEKVKNGAYLDGEKITLSEFAERWLKDYAAQQLKPKSVDWYKSMLNDRILPVLGHLTIAKIQPHHLINFMNDLKSKGAFRDIKYMAKPGLTEKIRRAKLNGTVIGIHPNTLRNAKTGHMVSPDTAKKIADALQLKVKDLFIASGLDKPLSAQTATQPQVHIIRTINRC